MAIHTYIPTHRLFFAEKVFGFGYMYQLTVYQSPSAIYTIQLDRRHLDKCFGTEHFRMPY